MLVSLPTRAFVVNENNATTFSAASSPHSIAMQTAGKTVYATTHGLGAAGRDAHV
jgi:diphthamide biosynthesis methyltransferase